MSVSEGGGKVGRNEQGKWIKERGKRIDPDCGERQAYIILLMYSFNWKDAINNG